MGTLVSKGTAIEAAAASISPAFGVATSAGNCLIATVTARGTNIITTTEPGWVEAVTTSAAHASIWYKPNCAAGETAPTFTSAVSSEMRAQLSEWHDIQLATPLDKTGSVVDVTSPTVVTAASADTQAGNLVITCYHWLISTTGAVTTADTYGANATAINLGNNDSNAGTISHARFSYANTTGNGIADTDTGTCTATVTASWAVIASFISTPVVAVSIWRDPRTWLKLRPHRQLSGQMAKTLLTLQYQARRRPIVPAMVFVYDASFSGAATSTGTFDATVFSNITWSGAGTSAGSFDGVLVVVIQATFAGAGTSAGTFAAYIVKDAFFAGAGTSTGTFGVTLILSPKFAGASSSAGSFAATLIIAAGFTIGCVELTDGLVTSLLILENVVTSDRATDSQVTSVATIDEICA